MSEKDPHRDDDHDAVRRALADAYHREDIADTRMVHEGKFEDVPSASPTVETFVRDMTYAGDVLKSRENPRLEGEEGAMPRRVAEQLINYVNEQLYDGVYSREQLKELIAKLDTALAINNDPDVLRLRDDLKERYGKDVV